MKSKSLILITASLITVTAMLLTVGLSLLHSSAFESTPDEAPIDGIVESVDEAIVDEVIDPVDEAAADEVDVPETEKPIVEVVIPDYDYPDFEYDLVDVTAMHYCGCPQDLPYYHSSHKELLNGVTIDIYSHKTGELVGQLAMASKDINNYIDVLAEETLGSWINTYDPYHPEEALNLPKGDYRIEVYADGFWFSYTYGDYSMIELTQCSLTHFGGAKLTGYIDYLISDYVAEIAAGNVEKPNPDHAVSKLEYAALEGYWEGYWESWEYDDGEVISYYCGGNTRWTERFPYIED